jgi:ribosomal protein S18 acetylase RimI-like enzyme
MEFKIIGLNDGIFICKKIAKIHLDSYSSNHFTSGFSLDKLAEYYLCLIDASDLSFIATEDNEVLGFVISGTDLADGVKNFIDENRFWLLLQLLKRPQILCEKLFDVVRGKFHFSKPSEAKYRLLSIATASNVRSLGVGSAMLKFLERELIAKNINIYGLSVKYLNISAIRFYERNGFLIERNYLGSSYYIKRIGTI